MLTWPNGTGTELKIRDENQDVFDSRMHPSKNNNINYYFSRGTTVFLIFEDIKCPTILMKAILKRKEYHIKNKLIHIPHSKNNTLAIVPTMY